MKFSTMQPGQEGRVIDLVKEVFDECVAPAYTQEGIEAFYTYADVKQLAKRSKTDHFTILAREGDRILGMIEIRTFNHVALFFVQGAFRNKGVGQALFKRAMAVIRKSNPDIGQVTVNSSLNAVPAYERMGFKVQSPKQCVDGIWFVPMTLRLDDRS